MPSEIIRGRATSCCSLAVHTSAARDPCNAASDWVGSCAITIKRRRDRKPKVQSWNSDFAILRAAIGDRIRGTILSLKPRPNLERADIKERRSKLRVEID